MASLPLTAVDLMTVHVCQSVLANVIADIEVAIKANQ